MTKGRPLGVKSFGWRRMRGPSPGSQGSRPRESARQRGDWAMKTDAEIDLLQRDVDPEETREWKDALEAVVERDGPERAHYLVEALVDKARRSGAYLPYNATTAYINTIPPQQEAQRRGDPALERRIKSIIRWNAMAMVVRANRDGNERRRPHRHLPVGGHPLRGRLQPLLPRPDQRARRRPGLLPGPQLARDLRPRLPRGPDHRGAARRLPPGGRRQGPLLLSAPLADARLLAVPDGVDGADGRSRPSTRRGSCATCTTAA